MNNTSRRTAVSGRRGQVALESLMIISFLFLLLIPLLFYVFTMLSSESWKLDAQQASAAAHRLTSIADQLALGGDGAFTTEMVYLPSSVIGIRAVGKEITFFIDGKEYGIIEQTAVADANLTLNNASDWNNVRGMNIILLNATGGTVLLTR